MDKPSAQIGRSLFHVAWMSIVIGIVMQILSLVFVRMDSVSPIVKDLSQKISWSMLVCMALAVATAVSREGAVSAGKSILVAITGLLAAPAAFIAARAIQKAVATALNLAGGATAAVSLVATLAGIKAVEYAILGYVLTQARANPTAKRYMLRGLIAGAIFGPAIVLAQKHFNPAIATGQLLATGVNEILFPVMCSGVICFVENLGKKIAAPVA